MTYSTYILENPEGKLYIGQTQDMEARLERHNGNQVPSTKNKGPWHVIFLKTHNSRNESVHYERYLKSLKNSAYIRRVVVAASNPGE